jgi:hypothetical protein
MAVTKKPAAKKATKPAAKKTTKTAKPAAKKTTAKAAPKKAAAKPAAKKTTAKAAPAPKVGGEITVNGNKIMKTLQTEFSKKFEYLTLCFIVDEDREKSVNVRGINTNKRLSEVRKKFSNEEISLHGRTKVQNIEKYFWEELGIACQIGICNYNGHAHYFPIGSFNGMTLSAANDWAKNAGCKKVGATEIAQICRGSIF